MSKLVILKAGIPILPPLIMNSQLAIVTDINSTITIKRSLYKELSRDFGTDITIFNQVGKEFQFNLTYFAEKQTMRLNVIFSTLLSQN